MLISHISKPGARSLNSVDVTFNDKHKDATANQGNTLCPTLMLSTCSSAIDCAAHCWA